MSWIRKILNKLKKYGTLVMFSHTIFSLSFAAISFLDASNGRPRLYVLFWAALAFLGARTGANALNRVIDAPIDEKNPRTTDRQIPRGELLAREAILFSMICFGVMIISAAMLNPLCLTLSPVALVLMWGYSYTKRFTWLCHIILGITCACAPVGAWLAVTGHFAIRPLLLGGANCLWTAGFDIIYGAQDYAFDKENGLYSIPVRFGVAAALRISSAFHIAALLFLIVYGWLSPFMGLLYHFGLALIACLMLAQHKMVAPGHFEKASVASYSFSQYTSLTLLLFGLLDIYL